LLPNRVVKHKRYDLKPVNQSGGVPSHAALDALTRGTRYLEGTL